MRTVATLLALVSALSLGGCTGGTPSGAPAAGPDPAPAGCGVLPAATVTALLGSPATSTRTGSLAALRQQHRRLTCTSVVRGHPERFVRVVAQYHPRPLALPVDRACDQGWVYAGTPEHYAPACQETVAGHGRTELVVRWQPYVMHLTVGRTHRDWGGDPELALAMSRSLARRLGVAAAAGDG